MNAEGKASALVVPHGQYRPWAGNDEARRERASERAACTIHSLLGGIAMLLRPKLKSVAALVGSILIAIGLCCVLLAAGGLAPAPYTCIVEAKKSVTQSELTFEISETDCSTFGETASMSIYASKAGDREKALLLKYGPIEISELSSISVTSGEEILISIPWVTHVISERDKWRDFSIKYNIGRIEYPILKEDAGGKNN